MKAYGKLDWALSGGRIPFNSTGGEQEPYSYEGISVLNTSGKEVLLELFIFYEDEEPAGPYTLRIPSGRVRKIRFNNLIEPFPIELERNYACLISASHPVVVQFIRLHTGTEKLALMGSMAFPVES